MYSGIDVNYIHKKVGEAIEEYHSGGDKEGLQTELYCMCSNICLIEKNKLKTQYRELLDNLSGWQNTLSKDSEMYKQLEKIKIRSKK